MKPERLSRDIVYQSPWVNLYLDKVKFPNGLVIEKFHLLDFPRAAVTAIVENDLGDIVFARIPRYTTGAAEWELPAGGVEMGESEIDAARRDVLEETGYTSDNHKLIYSYYPMNEFFARPIGKDVARNGSLALLAHGQYLVTCQIEQLAHS